VTIPRTDRAAQSSAAAPVAVPVSVEADVPSRMVEAGIPVGLPVITVVGGASGLRDEFAEAARVAIAGVIVPVAVSRGAAIVDGGTDSGVMGMVGRCHAAAGATSPLIGVAVQAMVRRPVGTAEPDAQDAQAPEPHHRYLVLVPGREWGDESAWLSAVADALCAGRPSVTVVVNGGEITLQDVRRSLEAHRPVVATAGTGRSADAVAAAVDGCQEDPADSDDETWTTIREGIAAGLVTVLDPGTPLPQRRAQLDALIAAD